MEAEEIKNMMELEDRHWWFCGKRALVKNYLGNSGLLLDIGCGTGANIKAFSSSGVGAEFSKEAVKMFRERTDNPLVRCSADELPFKGSTFDTITILDVLEHLEKDQQAMKDIFRILKPGGRLIITVPAHMFLWHKHDVVLHHKRRYCMKELETKLEKEGFKINKISYWNFLLFPGVLIMKLARRKTSRNQADTFETNRFFNSLLLKMLSIDNILIKNLYLPFGVSIFCVAEKGVI